MKLNNRPLAALGLALALPLSGCGIISWSDGNRAGVVTKISYKGFFCKSWEGQLAMDNFRAADSNSAPSNSFDFSVTDQTVVNQLRTSMNDGDRVDLTYHQYIGAPPCGIKTEYVITNVASAHSMQSDKRVFADRPVQDRAPIPATN